MRIAVTGSAGIGKTTLVNALATELSLPVIAEDLQEWLQAVTALGRLQRDSASPDEIRAARAALIRNGLDWIAARGRRQAELDSFVADRFAIDMLQRFLLNGVGAGNNRWLLGLVAEVRRQGTGLDLIVIPPFLHPSNDQTNDAGLKRHTSLQKLLMSQALTRGLLDQLMAAPRLYLPASAVTTDERIALVKAALQRLASRRSPTPLASPVQ